MKVIFASSKLPAAVAINFFSGGSNYHHCGHIIGDFVVEARFLKGVVITPLKEFKARGKWAILEYEVPNEQAAEEFSKSLIGKNYDFSGAFGHPFGGRWANPDNWYCSEHVNTSLFKGGVEMFKRTKSITPRDLYIHPLGKLVQVS